MRARLGRVLRLVCLLLQLGGCGGSLFSQDLAALEYELATLTAFFLHILMLRCQNYGSACFKNAIFSTALHT